MVERLENGSVRAARAQVWRCGHCPHVHVTAFDSEGNVCTEIVLSREMVDNIASASLYPDNGKRRYW